MFHIGRCRGTYLLSYNIQAMNTYLQPVLRPYFKKIKPMFLCLVDNTVLVESPLADKRGLPKMRMFHRFYFNGKPDGVHWNKMGMEATTEINWNWRLLIL